jgi:hypothetical protein
MERPEQAYQTKPRPPRTRTTIGQSGLARQRMTQRKLTLYFYLFFSPLTMLIAGARVSSSTSWTSSTGTRANYRLKIPRKSPRFRSNPCPYATGMRIYRTRNSHIIIAINQALRWLHSKHYMVGSAELHCYGME